MFSIISPHRVLASESQKEYQRKALSPILKKYHLTFPNCSLIDDKSVNGALRYFTYPLDKKTEIYGILCDKNPLNTRFSLYLVPDNNYHNSQRLYFPTYSKDLGWGGRNNLDNASYDPDTKTLSAYTKFHAQKQCGSRSNYKWTGKAFKLLHYRLKPKCNLRQVKLWPLVYSSRSFQRFTKRKVKKRSRRKTARRKFKKRRLRKRSRYRSKRKLRRRSRYRSKRRRRTRLRYRHYKKRGCYRKYSKKRSKKRRRRVRK